MRVFKGYMTAAMYMLWVLMASTSSAATVGVVGKEIAPGVWFEKSVTIPTRDGSPVIANVYRPTLAGSYPVIISMSSYGKDLHTKAFSSHAWEDMKARVPGLLDNSSGAYHSWEAQDPEVWVPYGYVLIRVDSRGSGKSPGYLNPFSRKEVEDYYDAIEWAAEQPWSNGKVGMAGISYFAIIQWMVASMQPPHLAGFIPWEGASDGYRDIFRHGGILSNLFPKLWWGRQIEPVQHGNGTSPFKDADDGSPVGGPNSLSAAQLAENRFNSFEEGVAHPLNDSFYTGKAAGISEITAPFLSSANWGGLGLHLRGNVQGFLRSSSQQKWLETHGGNHYVPFFSARGQALQKEFFDHFLKGEDNGWDKRPPVILRVRHVGENFVEREEQEWPLARTEWRKLALDADSMQIADLVPAAVADASYAAMEEAVIFTTDAFEVETEITGPLMANLWVSSSTSDMDIFATLQLFAPDGSEVTFEGASEYAVPISQGWLRASHRTLDPDMSTPYRPYHAHAKSKPLTPGEVYEVQVEIWPTSIVVPSGYTLALRLEGRDFSRAPTGSGPMTGSGPFLHIDPRDRLPKTFGGTNTIHTGGGYESYLLLPVIPSEKHVE